MTKEQRFLVNMKQKITVVIIDVLILAELCIGMYFAVRNPDDFNAVFFKVFLGMFIPTLAVGIFLVRKLRSPDADVHKEVES